MSRNHSAIVKALLSKTVARGATVNEEEASIAKAVEIIGKYALPHSFFTWPPGWDYSGRRVAQQAHTSRPHTPPPHQRHGADWGRTHSEEPKAQAKRPNTNNPRTLGQYAEYLLQREYAGRGYTYAAILARIKVKYPGSKTTVASLRWYEVKLRKEGKHVPKDRRLDVHDGD